MFEIRRYADAGAFLDRAEAWLMRAEAEHNLLLGIGRGLVHSTEGYEPPIYLATVEAGGAVVGCVFRTPPIKLGLTRMPEAALPMLVDAVAEVYEALPAVLGPEPQVGAFARLWGQKRGVGARPGTRQRIYQLEAVTLPEPMAPGRLRLAEAGDVDRVAAWMEGFSADTGIPTAETRHKARLMIDRQALYLWEDEGAPVSMAGWAGRTPHGARIGYVYTPPEARGRGYATACTAVLSQRLLDAGLRFCFLYTDLANPISNSIYQRIGYRPVCDVMDYDFDPLPD